MKKRILSTIIILAIFLNIISPKVYAQETNTEEASPIYKVVVPTNYSFIVDPYEILDEDSMIASPEFNIINKSSIPIKVHISFQISAKEGVILDIKNATNMVSDISYNNEIWIAAVFSTNNEKEITKFKILKTQQGDVIYQYLEEQVEETAEAVSGSAISLQNDENNPIQNVEQAEETAQAVSGSAISVQNDEINPIQNVEQVEETAQAVSGSAISVQNDEINPIQNVEQADETTQAVSGSAISVQNDEINPIQNGEQVEETVQAVSGSAISVQNNENNPIQNGEQDEETVQAVSGSAITAKYSTMNKIKDEYGKPVIYQDTIRVIGQYGDIDKLNEKSPNVLAINNEWNTKSFVLDKANVYKLSDGTIVTGATALNNNGVATFRFIGVVNRKVKWSETDLKVTIKFTFDEFNNINENVNNKYINNTEPDSNINTENYLDTAEVKTGLNNSEEQSDNNLVNNNNSNDNDIGFDVQNKIE